MIDDMDIVVVRKIMKEMKSLIVNLNIYLDS